MVTSATLFGEFTSLRTFRGHVIARLYSSEGTEAPQEEISRITEHFAQSKVKHALYNNTPRATNRSYEPGKRF